MIRQATVSDACAVAHLAARLWPSHTAAELSADFEKLLTCENAAVFLCTVDGKPIGFAQCQLRRDYVEGAHTSPVGYLEGVFIEEGYRHCGYGKQLVRACEQWTKENGCTELASDCEPENRQSLAFHLGSGFREANRIICFVKKL